VVGTWVQGVVRGVGASLIAPLVLLFAATVLAASGSGFGAVSSLGQVASGPDLPTPNTELAGTPDLKNNEVVGVERDLLASASRPPAATSAAGGGAGTGTSTAGGGPITFPSPQGGPVASGPLASNPTVSTPSSSSTGSSPPASSPAPQPLNNLLQETRQLGNSVVPQPLRPVTDNILNTVLGP
jgi:hypothetical protein